MKCNTEIHNEMITMEYIDCPFCDQELRQPSTIYLLCCENKTLLITKAQIYAVIVEQLTVMI